MSELEQAHDKARLADARRRSEISGKRKEGSGPRRHGVTQSSVGRDESRDQHVNDARDGRRAAEALLRTEVGSASRKRATGLRMEALLATRPGATAR